VHPAAAMQAPTASALNAPNVHALALDVTRT
jgi:hypothetical protein